MKYEEITKQIIGCAMNVHNTLGNGFQEVIYQRALEIEFKLNNISQLKQTRQIRLWNKVLVRCVKD